MSGRFIVFEGLDGSGKTTQMLETAKRLSDAGYSCITEFEPTDGEIGRLIRRALRKEVRIGADALAMLFAADRSEHIKRIKNELAKGTVVLCDRYVYSNVAYQSLELDADTVISYNAGNTAALMPDTVFYIDTPPEECVRRIAANREEEELYERLDILRSVYNNYMDSFKNASLISKTEVVIIDGKLKTGEITEKIFSKIIDSL